MSLGEEGADHLARRLVICSDYAHVLGEEDADHLVSRLVICSDCARPRGRGS